MAICCWNAQAPGWPSVSALFEVDKVPQPAQPGPSRELESHAEAGVKLSESGAVLKRSVEAACQAVIDAAKSLDALDQRCG